MKDKNDKVFRYWSPKSVQKAHEELKFTGWEEGWNPEDIVVP